MRTFGRAAAAVLAAGALFTLAACGGGDAATTTANTSPAASSPTTSTVEEAARTSSTAAAPAVDPAFAALAAEWSPKLQDTKNWATPADPSEVVSRHTELTQLQTGFLTAATAAGVRLSDYPAVKKASDTSTSGLQDFDAVACALAQPKSAQALTCGMQVLASSWNAQSLGLVLDTAAQG